MTSPEPSGYPHHVYGHQDTSPPLQPNHQGMSSAHDLMYSDIPYHHHHHHHYNPPAEPIHHHHPHHHHQSHSFSTPPPHPHSIPHQGHDSGVETEQPLDLSLSRSPFLPSAGSHAEVGPALSDSRAMMDEGSASCMREPSSELGQGDPRSQPWSGMCLLRGCSCRHSPVPVHHAPHYTRGHRHSPYPQYPVSTSGRHSSSPSSLGGGDACDPYSPHHSYSVQQSSRPPSSPGILYGGHSSPYLQDKRSHSPGAGNGGEMVPQRPSSGSLLCTLPHNAISPLSISTHMARDLPYSSCPPAHSLAAPRMREVSPRPLYRPFQEVPHMLADMPHAAPVSSSSRGCLDPYPTEDDLSASSTLLMLSNPSTEAGTGRASMLSRQTAADSSVDSYRPQREQPAIVTEAGARPHYSEPTQSDAGNRLNKYHHPLPSTHTTSHGDSNQLLGNREARSRESYHTTNSQMSLGPAQDGTVASSYSSDFADSPSPARRDGRKSRNQQGCMDMDSPSPTHDGEGVGKKKNVQSRSCFMTVVGTTSLAALREERAKKQAAHKDRMKELLSNRNEPQRQNGSNNSEGTISELNSSGQASPRSSDSGSDNDVGQGFPIPPDPNLKMSALDYLISKVLVERVDVPFKACNTEIKEIFTGAKKGRLTLVDLIELQVEASLKA